MKAILVHQTGGPEQLHLDEVPVPSPGPGQALVKIAAIGVNFIDTYHRSGLYKLDLPAAIGSEASGTVEAVGPDVAGIKTGDHVAYAMTRGSYAGYAVVPSTQLVKLPADISFQQAAAVMLQGMTAHYLATSTFPLKEGDVALVHAAAGGVGLLLVQIAKMRGATVLGTCSTEAKAKMAKDAGADHVILYSQLDVAPEARRLTCSRGVDVVYDGVGAATFEGSLDSLRPRGMLVSYGNASGAVPPFSPLLLSQKGSLFLTRTNLGHYIATRQELLERAGDVLGWVASGKLKLRIERTYPLSAAAQAHIDLEGRKTTGKLLLIPGE